MSGLSTPIGNTMKFISLRQSKEDKAFYFCLNEKVDGKWQITEKHSRFEGVLKDVELGSYEYNGSKVDTMSLFFDADGTTYKLECNFNLLSRSLINTLSAATDAVKEGIAFRIDVYVSKKDGYNKIIVKSLADLDAKLPWRLPVSDQAKIEKVELNGKQLIDDSKVNSQFKRMITEVLRPACPGLQHENNAAPEDTKADKFEGGSDDVQKESDKPQRHTSWPTPGDIPQTLPEDREDDLPF